MGWILGFGIPIAYTVIGAYLSRALYRSRHKRGFTDNYIDSEDTTILSVIMFFLWPLMAWWYFPYVWTDKSGHKLIEKFYKHNLPETYRERERRMRAEIQQAKLDKREAEKAKSKREAYIDQLERELKVGPYKEV